MIQETQDPPEPRVIGLDVHPDTFTAAVVRGPTPASAEVVNLYHHQPLSQLARWAQKFTTAQDMLVLEASGNSFHVARLLAGVERPAKVLESCQMGKLKEAHANNDKISAVRIAKAYLAGTAKEVWVPDPLTQERRDWMHAHRKAVKRTTQMNHRIGSYFSDQGVRLPQDLGLATDPVTTEKIHKLYSWTPRQWQVVEVMFMELKHANEQRAQWRSLMAQEVLTDVKMLALVRLCGVRDIVAFSLMAIIGNIERFESPKKLVKYVGLNPAFDESGEGAWKGGIGGHGRKDLRALLIEAAQALMRTQHPLAKWGRKLMGRKGSLHVAVAAVARKLTVAIWYLMKGRWTALEEIEPRLALKVGKIISQVGAEKLKALGQTRKGLREATFQALKTTEIYVSNPAQKMPVPSEGQSKIEAPEAPSEKALARPETLQVNPGEPNPLKTTDPTQKRSGPATQPTRKPTRVYVLDLHKKMPPPEERKKTKPTPEAPLRAAVLLPEGQSRNPVEAIPLQEVGQTQKNLRPATQPMRKPTRVYLLDLHKKMPPPGEGKKKTAAPAVPLRDALALPEGKIINPPEAIPLQDLSKTPKTWPPETRPTAKKTKIYVLDPNKKMPAPGDRKKNRPVPETRLGDAVPQTP